MERSFELELIDIGDFSTPEYEQCMQQLKTINVLTTGYRPTLDAIKQLANEITERPLRILDIGFGYGDTLREIAMWAKKNNVAVELVGVELNTLATELAKKMTPADLNISFRTQDVFQIPEGENYHLVISALMTHHLNTEELKNLLGWMTKHATHAWFVNDLHRHWLPWIFIKYFSRVFGFNRLIRNDAPLSVRRGFTRKDWLNAIDVAHLNATNVDIRWWWPFRHGVLYRVR